MSRISAIRSRGFLCQRQRHHQRQTLPSTLASTLASTYSSSSRSIIQHQPGTTATATATAIRSSVRSFSALSSSSILIDTNANTNYNTNANVNLNLNLNARYHSSAVAATVAQYSTDDNTNTDTDNDDNANNDNDDDDDAKPIISKEEYNPLMVAKNIHKAAQWNQGNGPDAKWDPLFCSQSVDAYTEHLRYIQHYIHTHKDNGNNDTNTNGNSNTITNTNVNKQNMLPPNAKDILSSPTTERALKAMLKMNIPTHTLSQKIRQTEKQIGSIGYTPLTNTLSLRLIEANGKAGNIGRTLALLNLRHVRQFKPYRKEYELSIQSIQSAGLYLRKNRNLFMKDVYQPQIDNPTRWLDAILVNMSMRHVPLDTNLANRMLDCYACTGRNGKALHFFYKVTKKDVVNDMDMDDLSDDDDMDMNDDMNDEVDIDMDDDSDSNVNANVHNDTHNDLQEDQDNQHEHDNVMKKNQTSKIRMKMRKQLPPFYKIPSDVKLHNELVKRPRRDGLVSKIEWEKEKEWSPSLTAAFAFAESLTHGACGHQPIELDLASWNTLIKVCCYRGAIFRALEILNDTMPQNDITPDVFTYNTILAALARVGDKDFMREMLTTMTNQGINGNKYTVKALVDGYLNSGDISGAVSLIQDMFNQHKLLPPYTTHLKIIEFALGNDLHHEAKRHVYFIQQLWKWKPKPDEPKSFQNLMYATQRNPKLSKKSLQGLFSYFGEELLEEDFF